MKVLKLVLIVIFMSNFYGKTQEIADSIKSADLYPPDQPHLA
jgi:hypothetical protein